MPGLVRVFGRLNITLGGQNGSVVGIALPAGHILAVRTVRYTLVPREPAAWDAGTNETLTICMSYQTDPLVVPDVGERVQDWAVLTWNSDIATEGGHFARLSEQIPYPEPGHWIGGNQALLGLNNASIGAEVRLEMWGILVRVGDVMAMAIAERTSFKRGEINA